MDGPKYSKTRERLIDKLEKDLIARAGVIQRKIYSLTLEYISELEQDETGIANTARNTTLINRLDRYIRDNLSEDIQRFASWLYRSLKDLGDANARYFQQFGDNNAEGEANKVIRNLGLIENDGDVSIVSDSFVSNLTDTTEPVSRVKSSLRAGLVGAAIALPALRKTIKRQLVGTDTKLGAIESRFNNEAAETFVRSDAIIGREVAKGLGLRAAVFSGGLITTSRTFCEERNAKVFTYEEIEAFRDLDWPEKPDLYDPFVDPIGGYNCRHKWDHVSDELAVILRPDLKDQL